MKGGKKMEKFYQICFSRLGKNDVSAGWQLLNMSPDLPRQMKEFYENHQKGNQPDSYKTPKDINGKDLCMLEILCNGAEVGISRVQYGLTDSFGREKMICQGFLFANAYELLKDPNKILSISDSNFDFSEEQPAAIPSTLKIDEPFTEERALRLCGMDQNAYIELVLCAYHILEEKAAKNIIHIKTDGTDQMARALMYLIYSAIPYSLRTRIKAATFSGTTGKNANVVLCRDIPENCLYLDPVTGSNNILTPNMRKRWERYPFVDYYARNYDRLSGRKDQYYAAIEEWLRRMGDPYLNKMDALRLAFSMLTEQDDSDIGGLLYDWMSLDLPVNETIEQSIADLLNKAIQRKLNLGEDKEKMLFSRLERTSSAELLRLGNQYQARRMLEMSLEEAVRFMENLTPESRIYNAIRANLSGSSRGLDILREYYLKKVKAVLSNQKISYSELEDLGRLFSDLSNMDALWQLIVERAVNIAEENIIKGISYVNTATELGTFLSKNYKSANWDKCLYRLARVYNDEFRNRFQPERLDEYVQFYQKQYQGGEEEFAYSAELVKRYQAIRNGNWLLAADFAVAGCPLFGVAMHPVAERQKAVSNLMSYALYCGAPQECMQVEFWYKMAKSLGRNPIRLMIDNKARVFCDITELQASVAEDTFWTDEKLEKMSNLYQEYVELHADNTYKKNYEVMLKGLKARREEAKQMQKAQKRQERQERRAAAVPSGRRDATKEEVTYDEYWASLEECRQARRKNQEQLRDSQQTPPHDRQRNADRKKPEQESKLSGLQKLFGGFGGHKK